MFNEGNEDEGERKSKQISIGFIEKYDFILK